MPQRTCGAEGCAKPHRARGLCSTHYNHRHQPDRHRGRTVPCSICQTPVTRGVKSDRRHVCSVACRTILQYGEQVDAGAYNWAYDAARRARLAGATVVEIFDRDRVFERDAWACGICCLPVRRDAEPFDPESPTVDHVVPLSQGGQHTMDNVQCAHLRCNSAKQDVIAGHAA